MLAIDIPGFRELRLEHLVLDFNGTLAVDGRLLSDVREMLHTLAEHLSIHVVTADTFMRAAAELDRLPVNLHIVGRVHQADEKLNFIKRLGPSCVAAIGNGRNDQEMLRAAALGIAVVQKEGAASQALAAADIVVPGIADALGLLVHPLRLTATLRT